MATRFVVAVLIAVAALSGTVAANCASATGIYALYNPASACVVASTNVKACQTTRGYCFGNNTDCVGKRTCVRDYIACLNEASDVEAACTEWDEDIRAELRSLYGNSAAYPGSVLEQSCNRTACELLNSLEARNAQNASCTATEGVEICVAPIRPTRAANEVQYTLSFAGNWNAELAVASTKLLIEGALAKGVATLVGTSSGAITVFDVRNGSLVVDFAVRDTRLEVDKIQRSIQSAIDSKNVVVWRDLSVAVGGRVPIQLSSLTVADPNKKEDVLFGCERDCIVLIAVLAATVSAATCLVIIAICTTQKSLEKKEEQETEPTSTSAA